MSTKTAIPGALTPEDVQTCIQSGFTSDTENAVLEESLEKAMAQKYGFDIPVIVRSADKLQSAVNKKWEPNILQISRIGEASRGSRAIFTVSRGWNYDRNR